MTSTSSCTQVKPPQTQTYASTPNVRLHRKGKKLLHPLYLTFLNLVPCFNPCIRKNCRLQKEPVDYVYGLCDNVRTVSTVQRVTYAATPLMHMSANVSGWKFGGCIFSAACILCHLRCFCLFEDVVGMIWFEGLRRRCWYMKLLIPFMIDKNPLSVRIFSSCFSSECEWILVFEEILVWRLFSAYALSSLMS